MLRVGNSHHYGVCAHVCTCRYWAKIDDALRSAAYNRGVTVRLMGSHWNHTDKDMSLFFASLSANSGTGPFGGKIQTVSCVDFL